MTGVQTCALPIFLLKGRRTGKYVLCIVMHDKRLDTKTLAKTFNEKSFSFASAEDLMRLLHVTPGSVTPFGLLYDTAHEITVLMDEDAWSIGTFRFHPMINTSTLTIDREGLEKFVTKTGHEMSVVRLPVITGNH